MFSNVFPNEKHLNSIVMKIEDTISSVIQEGNFAETVVCITLWISFFNRHLAFREHCGPSLA